MSGFILNIHEILNIVCTYIIPFLAVLRCKKVTTKTDISLVIIKDGPKVKGYCFLSKKF